MINHSEKSSDELFDFGSKNTLVFWGSLSLQDGLRASRGPASRSGIGLEPSQRPGSGPGMVAGSGPGSGPRAGKDLTRDLARDLAWLLARDLNTTSRFGGYHTKTNRKLGTWYGCWPGTWLGTSSRERPGQRPGSDLAMTWRGCWPGTLRWGRRR